MKPQQIGILVAGAVTLLLWLVPGAHLILLPLQYLDTHLHEMSHALATVFTGGSVETIQVYGNGSGVTQSLGVHHWVIVASAGYVGASLIGAALIFFTSAADFCSRSGKKLPLFGVSLNRERCRSAARPQGKFCGTRTA